MTLADRLPFFERSNYKWKSYLVGGILGVFLGAIGIGIGGFLYSYFSFYYNQARRDLMEGAKMGGFAGLISFFVVIILTVFLAVFLPGVAMEFSAFESFLLSIFALIISPLTLWRILIVGVIFGAIGGAIACYVE